ncbi:MAG: hypothetical protein NWQ54_08075 [Paraglaciecola sp.]|uniref:HvfA family oxazolone/thioamide-modified RiPP metallophore n=1 Tax=Pseudomonadati TaxID=3379134 RepID=UPI00273F75CD|nr:hypothetical protein [Paraglaciecola sp.]MDP5031482.1 hypothetical protein [Paraglaciecola sp.]MDP5040654.1 hypothetical protein [Paraglaciecola sp.]MDP5130827.1 hypothetical protein [Paraglaciecola sp.]
MNQIKKTAIASTIGAVVIGSLASVSLQANANPFEMQSLESGYMLSLAEGSCGGDKAAKVKDKEGKCGEGKCGGDKAKAMAKDMKEGKCGEGKCGGDKAKAMAKDMKEGKCGEGKCGGDKAKAKVQDKMKKEGKCGEGKCGEGKCGGQA